LIDFTKFASSSNFEEDKFKRCKLKAINLKTLLCKRSFEAIEVSAKINMK
jgi:hypothetical protein